MAFPECRVVGRPVLFSQQKLKKGRILTLPPDLRHIHQWRIEELPRFGESISAESIILKKAAKYVPDELEPAKPSEAIKKNDNSL